MFTVFRSSFVFPAHTHTHTTDIFALSFPDNFVGFFAAVWLNQTKKIDKKVFALSPDVSAITHIYQLGKWLLENGVHAHKREYVYDAVVPFQHKALSLSLLIVSFSSRSHASIRQHWFRIRPVYVTLVSSMQCSMHIRTPCRTNKSFNVDVERPEKCHK